MDGGVIIGEIALRWISLVLLISQHWFIYWIGPARKQAITCDNIDPDLYRHIALLSPSNTQYVSFTNIQFKSIILREKLSP